MTMCRSRPSSAFTVCARGAIGLLSFCLWLVPSRAQDGSTATSATAITVVTVEVRPFVGDANSNPVLKNGKIELQTALHSAIHRTRDLSLRFSDTEALNELMTANNERQRLSHVIKGQVDRSIKADPPDYLITTTYFTDSANRVELTSQIFAVNGGVERASVRGFGDLKSTDPFGALGKQLMSELRRIVGLPPLLRPIIYVPCFQVIGDTAAAEALRDKLQIYRAYADQGLTQHASVQVSQDCAQHADLRSANAPHLYVKGTILVHSTVYKETNQRIVEYLLILSICRGQNLEEELRQQPARAPCDEGELLQVARDLGEKIGQLLEDDDFMESN